ncbi:putative tRNA(Adenine34) deaminase [Clavispora lusitaniae]|uniref:tRNA(Adenine34) deaminase n=1 Tax=Clavispora lusitaniae TaxID=36911 RepID=A0AA91Q4U6_CLALS|nr:putative tRNA(Adenine34) deaminase [Clavispora lusitaniae]
MDLTRHFQYMAVATFVAYRAFANGETPVACVFVHEPSQTILAFGCNDTNRSLNGTRHAEFMAIDKILQENHLLNSSPEKVAAFFSQVVLYVTVEPCVMCASALRHVGIKKVYFGAANDRFGGNGTVIKVQENDSYLSFGGIMRVEAVHLLRNFYVQENETAPVPKLKKNRDIEGKPFPPNLDFPKYVTKDQFCAEYGETRGALFYDEPHPTCEVTPVLGGRYDIKILLSDGKIHAMPKLGELYPQVAFSPDNQAYAALVEEDIDTLVAFLPAVTDNGEVNYEMDVRPKRLKFSSED